MRMNFIVWLSAGIVFGWLISRMYELDHRRTLRLLANEDLDSEQA